MINVHVEKKQASAQNDASTQRVSEPDLGPSGSVSLDATRV